MCVSKPAENYTSTNTPSAPVAGTIRDQGNALLTVALRFVAIALGFSLPRLDEDPAPPGRKGDSGNLTRI